MAISRVKTWIANEVLTASDLNNEFNNLLNNALSLVSPLTGNLNFNNNEATNFKFEVQSATQSVAAEGVVYWHTGEDNLHISTGSLQARVPALTSIVQGRLVGTSPAPVDGATTYIQVPLDSSLSMSAAGVLSVGTVTAARGGTGIDTSATATGSLLYTSSSGVWATLGPGSASQYLTVQSGVPNWTTIPSATPPKWVKFGGTGTILNSSGVSAVHRESAGEYRIVWTTPFGSTSYAVMAIGGGNTEQYVKTSTGTAYQTTHVWVSARNQNGTADDAVNGVITVTAIE